MDPIFGPIIGAAIQGGSSLLGGMFGASGQAATNAASLQAVQQQEQFQEQMSNTAYQRGMADMKAAGLNPILAANLGGAVSPTGAMPTLGNPGSFLQSGITSAGQMGQTMANMKTALTQADKDASQVDLNKSTTAYTDANKGLTDALNAKAQQDTATSAAQARAADASAKLADQNSINAGIQAGILQNNVTSSKAAADAATKWGPGVWGDLGNTAERAIGRIIDQFKSGTNPNTPPAGGAGGSGLNITVGKGPHGEVPGR